MKLLTAIFLGLLIMNINASADTASPDEPSLNNSTQSVDSEKIKQAELKARGKKLREFFEPYIQRANGKENWKLYLNFEREAYEFFPKGMSFEDATFLLKNAGFHIIPRPVPNDKHTFYLIASISLPNRYVYKTHLLVSLEPTNPRLENVQVKSASMGISVN
jgi:hypothetical protein